MEPLSPNDPLWKVLGQAKPVKPRPNFTQNVLRAARQTPQEKGWLSHLKSWFGTPAQIALRGAFAAITVIALTLLIERPWQPAQNTRLAQIENKAVDAEIAADSEFPATPEVSTQWENMEKFDALLAVEDTSQLTDREINFLLY